MQANTLAREAKDRHGAGGGGKVVPGGKGEVERTLGKADVAHVELATYTSVRVAQGGEFDCPKYYPAHLFSTLNFKGIISLPTLELLDVQGMPVGTSTPADREGNSAEKEDGKRKNHAGH